MLLKKKYFNIQDQIINADFLKVNINNIFTNKISLIGNFPYNISSQILFKILENKEDIIHTMNNSIVWIVYKINLTDEYEYKMN